jgi:UTP--glucose-1-phosphate uridylyltransferase
MIKKAVIPAAGLGTRFLPATKSLAKEMLPIIDIPTIQLIVEEAVKSGITDILIIINDKKQAIESHFDYQYELKNRLIAANKLEDSLMLDKIADLANIHYIHQKEPKGLGHAILCAKAFIGKEDFCVLLGDDIVYNKNTPALKQLINEYDKKHASILGVQEVSLDDVHRYGIVKVNKDNALLDFIEKPKREDAPSNLAVLGRYVLTSNIFECLEKTLPGKGGEIQLTDAIKTLSLKEKVYAYNFEGRRYDVGDKFGYVQATIEYGLRHDQIATQLKEYIITLGKELKKEK